MRSATNFKTNVNLKQLFSLRILSLILAGLLSTASGFYFATGASADATSAPPAAPSVEVAQLIPQEIRTWTRFSGRLTPVESVEIKPLVSGTIQQVLFEDGQVVQKGDPLFVIDPRPHQAQLQRAEAELNTARSRARLAQDELQRARQLLESKLISQSIFDNAASDDQVARATVQAAESAVQQARLNLEYAHIRSPIKGRVGRAELTVGNVVNAGVNAPVLTTVVADDYLYAEFNVDENTYIQSVRHIQRQEKMPVQLTLAGDDSSDTSGGTANTNSKKVYEGYIHAFDNRLDVASGTIRARAIFANVDHALTPGMYANISLGAAATTEALLVPERAIGTNQNRKFVYVIDKNNTVIYREVSVGGHYQSHRIILNGLTSGERIAVNSLSHLRPSTVINPVTVNTLNQLAAQ